MHFWLHKFANKRGAFRAKTRTADFAFYDFLLRTYFDGCKIAAVQGERSTNVFFMYIVARQKLKCYKIGCGCVRAHFLLASIKLRSTAAASDEFLSATQPLALFQPQYNMAPHKNFTLLFIFLTVRDEKVFFSSKMVFFFISHIFFWKTKNCINIQKICYCLYKTLWLG